LRGPFIDFVFEQKTGEREYIEDDKRRGPLPPEERKKSNIRTVAFLSSSIYHHRRWIDANNTRNTELFCIGRTQREDGPDDGPGGFYTTTTYCHSGRTLAFVINDGAYNI